MTSFFKGGIICQKRFVLWRFLIFFPQQRNNRVAIIIEIALKIKNNNNVSEIKFYECYYNILESVRIIRILFNPQFILFRTLRGVDVNYYIFSHTPLWNTRILLFNIWWKKLRIKNWRKTFQTDFILLKFNR